MRVRHLFAVPVLLFGCEHRQTATPQGIQDHVSLARAATCESLTRTVQDTAVRQMRSQVDAYAGMAVPAGFPAAAGGAQTPQASGAPASYTTTNVQVAGVDEADFVKNDGTRIFVLSGRNLFTATSWPPQDLAVAGKLEIEGWPSAMFLDGDRVVVLSNVWTVSQGGGGSLSGAAMGPCPQNGCFWGSPTTKITAVDVSHLSAPVVASELYLPGFSSVARRVGTSIRLVLGDGVRWPEAIQWAPPYDPALYQDRTKLAAALAALEEANEVIIRAAPLQSWFPPAKRKLPDGTLIDVGGYGCSDFYLSNAPERLGLVTLATMDLAHLDAGVSRSSIVAEPGVLYATATRLYLASRHWWWWPVSEQRDWTYVHAFDIGDAASAVYVGSGGVEGQVGDQFAMDEKDGYLRVATTTVRYSMDSANTPFFHLEVNSRLSVLAPQARDGGGQSLELVSEIAPLVAGERLMATRFTGDRGYAVTFRNVDPLVTLDLTDPAHPKKVAELTLPGFSTYLEPIDEGHLLAIGTELPLDSTGQIDWSKRSIQVSLFDVSDLAKPTRTAQALVGTARSYSEALWDHRAFNWYRPDPAKPGVLAIPFSDWVQPDPGQQWSQGFVSDVRFFSVDPSAGISALGSLSLGDVYGQQGNAYWTWWYQPWVRRSVMATDQAGNTFVYAVSDAGLRTAALARLDTPLATALFSRTTSP